MLSTYTPKKYLFPLLATITLLFLSAGHYSYKNYGEKSILNQPPNKVTPPPLLQQPFPPKIRQSWKDDSENPTERTIGSPHQWRATNPTWLYERITDDNMDTYMHTRFAATDPSLADLFTSLRDPILRADFLRYLILLRDGGVWLGRH